MDSLKTVVTRPGKVSTPQTKKADSRQVKNSAGGYTFTVSDMDRAKRFLILGSESSFYSSGTKLSKQNADNLIKIVSTDEGSKTLVDEVVAVSLAGRAPKQQPALFALAVASSFGSDESKAYALSKLNQVARTATALFTFVGYVSQFRGWGRGLRKAVANWYTSKRADSLGLQMVKYRSREGYTHADVLRLAHPKGDEAFDGLSKWTLRGDTSNVPRIVEGFEKAKSASVAKLPTLIREYGLTWEMLPTEALNDVRVWEALLDAGMPLGALIRNLPKLTALGILGPMSSKTQEVIAKITDKEELKKARIHPLGILIALKTYASGQGLRGSLSWKPVQKIVDALDTAFYLAFDTVEPAGKRTLVALDVSGSMGWGQVAGVPITPAEAGAALALVTVATEPKSDVVGFASQIRDLGISPKMRLDDVVRKTSNMSFGSTDASAAINYAMSHGIEVDTFIVITDNETWAGRYNHPHEALQQYRRKTGINAKLIVLATTATQFSIADPSDPGMLDIAGFDTSVPTVITEFSRS